MERDLIGRDKSGDGRCLFSENSERIFRLAVIEYFMLAGIKDTILVVPLLKNLSSSGSRDVNGIDDVFGRICCSLSLDVLDVSDCPEWVRKIEVLSKHVR